MMTTFRRGIPLHSGQLFRLIPVTYSDRFRPPVLTQRFSMRQIKPLAMVAQIKVVPGDR